jgi:hypothetical protein
MRQARHRRQHALVEGATDVTAIRIGDAGDPALKLEACSTMQGLLRTSSTSCRARTKTLVSNS